MPWQTVMTETVRVLISDLDDPYTYSDLRLQQTILVSARLVTQDVSFPNGYVVDIAGSGITPDPVDSNDIGFVNLVSLKAACMIDRAEARDAIAKGFQMKDGTALVDTRDFAVNKLQMIEPGKGGYCDQYEQAKLEYGMGNMNLTRIITGPFRTIDGFPH